MRFISLFGFFLCHLTYAACYPVYLGDEKVTIAWMQHGPGKTFVHVHQNETTALQAAKKVIQQQGGNILTLHHSGSRNIHFHLKGKDYEFDPNRIFSEKGIQKSLKQYGAYSQEAHRAVKQLADKILSLLPPGKIIAVHNNRSYSLKNYLPGQNEAKNAQLINFYDKTHYRNFYLVTRRTDYERLKKLHFNEVLQAAHPHDDGSLSVYLASRSYINVEAGFNQLKEQVRMLQCA